MFSFVIFLASFLAVFPFFGLSRGFVHGLGLRCTVELLGGPGLSRSGAFVLCLRGRGGAGLWREVGEFGG